MLSLEEPRVMGIVNLTSDSFYAGSRTEVSDVLNLVQDHIDEGADMVDLGAFSSRPGANEISEQEELDKLLPAIKHIHQTHPEIIISVDTYRSKVARAAIAEGAHIINDISAGDMDSEMFKTISDLGVPYIMMHMQGTPQSMQNNPQYKGNNPTFEIAKILSEKVLKLRSMGTKDIVIDPGFGFGKTIEHNFQILNHLEHFHILECPVLVGLSRKSMIYKTLMVPPEEALNGSSFCHTHALQKGAQILRVHDVKAAKELITLHQKMKTSE